MQDQQDTTFKEHDVIPLDNYDGRDRDVTLEVNWNEAVRWNSKIRLSMRDDNGRQVSAIIDNQELRTILFMLAPEENLDEFFHNRETLTQASSKQVAVKLDQDAKAGQTVMANQTSVTKL